MTVWVNCNPLRYWDPLGYYTAAEGAEAHRKLQKAFKQEFSGKTEYRVENYPYSDSGIGYIDIYLEDNGQGASEVYELKPNTQILNLDNSSNGVNQREGYITALEETAKKIKIDKKGTTFDPRGWTINSDTHSYLNIRYYTFPYFRPGMIYWGYVLQPNYKNEKKQNQKQQTKEEENYNITEIMENVLDKVAMGDEGAWELLGLVVAVVLFILSRGGLHLCQCLLP